MQITKTLSYDDVCRIPEDHYFLDKHVSPDDRSNSHIEREFTHWLYEQGNLMESQVQKGRPAHYVGIYTPAGIVRFDSESSAMVWYTQNDSANARTSMKWLVDQWNKFVA